MRSLAIHTRRRRPQAHDLEIGPSPAALTITSAYVRVGDGYAATFAVTGYPAQVGPAWLEPLLSYPGRVDVAVHIDPIPAELAAPMLRRQRARLESTRRLDADAGRLGDRSGAVLYGVNTTGNGALLWDRWAADNHNAVVLARSGAGKSYFVKLDVLRNLYQGVHVAVIDPDDEYADLAQHVGGRLIQLGKPGVRINPLDLPAGGRSADVLTRRGLFLHTLLAVMLGNLTAAERAVLDTAITATYTTAGITHDPATWTRPAPLLRDLAATLTANPDVPARELAARLHPWTAGSFANLFNGPTTTTTNPDADTAGAGTGAGAPLTVWSLRHLPDQTRAAATLLALDTIWRDTDTPTSAASELVRRLSPVRRASSLDGQP